MVTNIKKILVANRGEIALRVIRTAQEMGIQTVAIYAASDRQAQYVEMASEAYALSGDTYRDTYLNEDAIIDILHKSGADAVHPGYGFLSEVASFAQKVIDAGAVWIGPKPEALIDLGDKITARRVATRAKVPPVPGISEPVKDIRELLTFAQTHGYPVMMKRTDGGGGRGITVVHNDDELRGFYMNHDALQGGDLDEYFIERFIDKARHVETQVGRDSHGNFTIYSTRDCSVQRRNQKLVEEAPAPFLTDDENAQLHRYSRNLFEAVDYVGLGTCEYMVTSQHKVYFLEVNPRLQVEHTVSEEVSGLDLVREQLTIADGGELTQNHPSRGHSFELRITSEDPATNLTPSAGTLTKIEWPSGPGIRVDSGVEVGDSVSPKFDSMMGKLIVTAQNRDAAIARVRRALKELCIEGVPTPAKLFEQIFNDPDFTAQDHDFDISTKWLEHKYLNRTAAAANGGQPASLDSNKSGEDAQNKPTKMESFVIEVDNKRVKLTIPQDIVDNLTGSARVRSTVRASQPLRGRGLRGDAHKSETPKDAPGVISAPMQAVITRVNVAEGQNVAKGDLLAVLESMKMENYVYAPAAGVVTGIFVGPGDGVEAGEKLVTIDVTKGGSAK
ncbi:biotin carboxylase N-terminal domain-containing protein [Gardnerella vaginalis]|uniref:ATP-binding protein n=1 Tax=Gardnerella vaginalis TaxID=2702 RepID=UPI000943F4EC|nr:biotin carboxylase N-terminal domain-containing protein [Gardnerella vaginalis]AYZ21014.1 ATP-grasp domain-containing protein [Gardnerella vaginalis]OKY55524.1 Acetyl-/propionyl-coenzyme A carboxylase alpha chain [Gardnerella vaginalis]PKZ54058.1 ATP-grasp domain-containing protein [Gardnerella vaginalis]PKZ56170.1 ATP-grasp domain-containing protein [Gardnerella vaginalis]